MKKLWEMLKPIVTSKTIIAIVAGLIVQALVHFKVIDDSGVTKALEIVSGLLAAAFRVTATDNINPADPKQNLE